MYYLRSSRNASPPLRPSNKKPSPPNNKVSPSPSSIAHPPPTTTLVSLLVSHIQGQKSLKPILNRLYFLICSSLSYEVCQGNFGNTSVTNGFKLKLEDTVTLAVVLFKELRKKLVSSSGDAFVDGNAELAVIHVDGKDSQDELLLLLRCCLLLVRLHPYNQSLSEQLQIAVVLFRRLSIHATSTIVEREPSEFNAKPPDLYLRFFQRMQEVYLDEVFADRTFLEYIAISDSSTCQNFSMRCSIQMESVLEVIAAHFLVFVSGKDVFQTLTESLIWGEEHLPSPEVSLTVALSLIYHPVMKSAPTFIKSYLISLVSEVIGICVYPEKVGPTVGCKQTYLSTFHDSVILYCEHMSKLMTSSSSPGKIIQRPFEFYFHSEIYNRVNSVLDDLDNAWRTQGCRMFNTIISSMAIDAISYMKMNICIVDETYRNVMYSFLRSLISRLVSVEVDEVLLQSFNEMTVQDFCLLASILKLMSCSLLQASYFPEMNLGCLIALLKTKPDLMTFFAQCNLHIPIHVQQFIVHVLKLNLSKYDEFKLIFLHFTGLLSLSMFSGIRILVRGCLFLMLVLVNTLALKRGSLESRHILESGEAAVTSSPGCFDISRKMSSLRVASNFQKERRKLVRLLRDQTAYEALEISNEETCNGELLLKSISANRKDIDELKDFIECVPWRDYSARIASMDKTRHRRMQKFVRRLKLAKMRVRNTMESKMKHSKRKDSIRK